MIISKSITEKREGKRQGLAAFSFNYLLLAVRDGDEEGPNRLQASYFAHDWLC